MRHRFSTLFLVTLIRFFVSIATSRHPSAEEKNLVVNMTSWIQNDTIKMYVSTHLLFCPGQDMCYGPDFKRSLDHTFIPSCSVCMCTSDCRRRSNCCPWREYTQNDTGSPSFVQYVNRTNPLLTPKNNIPMECVIPLVRDENETNEERREGYFMISKCPASFGSQERVSKCEHRGDDAQYTSFKPVTSLYSNETFRNLDCALCNGESVGFLEPWKEKIVCKSPSALMQINSMETLNQRVFSETSECNVEFIPPLRVSDYSMNKCYNEKNYIAHCNVTRMWKTYDSVVENACHMNYVSPYTLCLRTFYRKVYKNIFCAICNVENWATDLVVECSEQPYIGDGHLHSFSALLDFGDGHKTRDKNCEFYDPLLKICHNPVCEESLIYQQGRCVPKHKIIDHHAYEVNIRVSSRSKSNIDIPAYSFPLLNLIKRHTWFLIELCSSTILVDSPDILNPGKPTRNFFIIHTTMVNGKLHDFKKSIEDLLDFFKFSFFEKNEFEIEILAQSFESRYISFSLQYSYPVTCCQNPFSDQPLYTFLSVDGGKVNHLCQSRSQSIVTIVSPATLCPRIVIDKRSTKVVLSNLTLCFPDLEFCVKPSYFVESRDRRSVEVCLDQYLEGVNAAFFKQKLSEEKIVSIVCLSLSSLGCIGTIVAYFVYENGRNLHSMNINALCLTMLIANTVYSLSGLAVLNPTLCQIVGGLNHFLWLSVVMWMVVSSLTTFRTFTSIRVEHHLYVCQRFLCNALWSFMFPLLMVILNILVSTFLLGDWNLGYSQYTCYITHSEMILYTFAVPLAGMVILNIFMFLVTFREIHTSVISFPEKIQQERHMCVIFYRLSTISGGAWFFGFLNMIVQSQVFSYLHILITGSQGLYLFFAFGIQLFFRNMKPTTTSRDLNKTSLRG